MGEEKKQKEEKPKNNNKKIIVVTITATILIVATIGGLIFAGKKYIDRKNELQALKNQLENLQKTPEPSNGEATITGENGETTVPPAETFPADEYSGWKTYTNSEIGYTLKYPADWEVQEFSEYSPIHEATVKYISIYAPGNKYFLRWGLREKNAGFYISDRTGIGAGEPKKVGSIKVLGNEYAINLFVVDGRTEEIFYPNAGISQSADGKYEFVANFEEGAGVSSNLLDMADAPERGLAEKILKSVALTGKTVSSSGCSQTFTNEENLNKADWKTVSNAKNGYSFKYPKDWTITTKKDDYINLGNAANGEYFEWRSGPMTGTDFMGFKEDSHKNISVGCQKAKITYLSGDPTADPPIDAKKRLVLVQFEKSAVPHVVIFTYTSYGASISSDVVEMFELILKTATFNK